MLLNINTIWCTVVELNDKNYAQVVTSRPFTLVAFYTDWCSHCHELIPQLEIADNILVQSQIHAIAKVNCEGPGTQVCDDIKIDMYPTVLVLNYGEIIEKYNGEKNADSIINFVMSKLNNLLESTSQPQPLSIPTQQQPHFYYPVVYNPQISFDKIDPWQSFEYLSNSVSAPKNNYITNPVKMDKSTWNEKDNEKNFNIYEPNIGGKLNNFYYPTNSDPYNLMNPYSVNYPMNDANIAYMYNSPPKMNFFYANPYLYNNLDYNLASYDNNGKHTTDLNWANNQINFNEPPTLQDNFFYLPNSFYNNLFNNGGYLSQYTGLRKHQILSPKNKHTDHQSWIWNPDKDLAHRPAIRQYMVPLKHRKNAIASNYMKGIFYKYFNQMDPYSERNKPTSRKNNIFNRIVNRATIMRSKNPSKNKKNSINLPNNEIIKLIINSLKKHKNH